MSIEVLHAGFFTTIQDNGRFGLQKYGIVVGGAMDSLALRLGNILVGNSEEEAVIEVTLFGTKLRFKQDLIIAITGANLQATINGHHISMWRPFYVKKGDILKFNTVLSGYRAYIAVAGGFNISPIMGSKSTYTEAKIGGYKGRALKKGDNLPCNGLPPRESKWLHSLKTKPKASSWFINAAYFYASSLENKIRFILGSEYEHFDKISQERLVTNPYKITPHSNRMGYRLAGPELLLKDNFDLLSEGVTFGTIQVPSNGQPIILMADRQTTGGYPKIGQVISVDLPRLAQLKPGDGICFSPITIKEAEELLIKREEALRRLKTIIHFIKEDSRSFH